MPFPVRVASLPIRKDKNLYRIICTGLKDGMTLLCFDVFGYMGMVLVSPTHNYNITARMKAFEAWSGPDHVLEAIDEND